MYVYAKSEIFKQKIIQWLPSNNPAILDSLDDASLQVPAIAVQAAEKAVYFSIFEILKFYKWFFRPVHYLDINS